MNSQITLLLIFAGFLGFGLVMGVLIFFVQRHVSPEPTIVQKRLSSLKEIQKKRTDGLDSRALELAKKMTAFYKESEYTNMSLGKFLEGFSFMQGIKKSLRQAEMKITLDQFFLKFMALPVVVGVVLGTLFKFLPLLAIAVVVPTVAIINVNMRKNGRMGKFTTQLPDALSLMSSSLRAGHSFQSALAVVSNELQPPLADELGTVVKEMNLGVPVREALIHMIENLDGLADIRMFVTAVLIQRESGGNLAEILDKLGLTIRERFKLKGQISSMTAQSRLTGYCLGGAPFALLSILTIFFPSYIEPMYKDPMGQMALGVGAFLQIIGFMIIKQIVDIKV